MDKFFGNLHRVLLAGVILAIVVAVDPPQRRRSERMPSGRS